MTIFSSLLNVALNPSFLLHAPDEVAVFDAASFKQVFENARPTRVVVKPTSRTMEHPIENGQSIADHRIINPLEIELSLITSSPNYNEVFNKITSLFQNATLLTVQTKFGTYRNMFITTIPHEEDPDMFDSISMSMTLKEVIYSDKHLSTFSPPAAAPSTASLFSKLKNGNISSIGLGDVRSAVTTGLGVRSYINKMPFLTNNSWKLF